MLVAALLLFALSLAGIVTSAVLLLTERTNLYLDLVVDAVALVPLLTIWVIAHYVAWELFKHN